MPPDDAAARSSQANLRRPCDLAPPRFRLRIVDCGCPHREMPAAGAAAVLQASCHAHPACLRGATLSVMSCLPLSQSALTSPSILSAL